MKTNAVVLIVSAGVGAALVGVGARSSMMGNKAKKVVIEDGPDFYSGHISFAGGSALGDGHPGAI